MGFNCNFNYMWRVLPGSKTRAKYIHTDVVNPYNLSHTQKNTAQKAIVWLLSKAPHSVDEIADHFEMSSQLVHYLLEELKEVNLVVREPGRPRRYKLKD